MKFQRKMISFKQKKTTPNKKIKKIKLLNNMNISDSAYLKKLGPICFQRKL